ncbi:hypothetical protein EBZ37_08700, partial [bacterium]|nr:hypothetical protein [bacterium]
QALGLLLTLVCISPGTLGAAQTSTPVKKKATKAAKAPLLALPERLPSGGRLRLQTSFSLSSWDWNHGGETIPAELLRAVHRGLYRAGTNGQLQPDLVESETASIDAQSWTFRFKQDLKWSDGTRFTAEDVATGLARAAEPSALHPPDAVRLINGFQEFHTGVTNQFAGVSVESPSILKVRLNTPDPLFPLKLTDPRTFPARGDLAKKYLDYGINVDHMAFLGPWRVSESRPGLKGKLSPNAYFGDTLRQSFREIELWHVTSSAHASGLFERNHLDALLGPIQTISADGVQSLPELSLIMLARGAGFARQCPSACMNALAAAIQRSTIERLRPADFWIPPELWASQHLGPWPKIQTTPPVSLRGLRKIRIAIPTSLHLEPDELALLRDIAKKISADFSKRLSISSTISFVDDRNSSSADLFLELHKAYSLALDSFLMEIEGPESRTFWSEWAQISPNSEERLTKLLARSRSVLEEDRKIIPIGYGIHFIRKKKYLGDFPF